MRKLQPASASRHRQVFPDVLFTICFKCASHWIHGCIQHPAHWCFQISIHGLLRTTQNFNPRVTDTAKIAAILSAYDELIENNKRRIALLEKLAEEIYREWFVRLRFPGHEKVKIVKGVPTDGRVKKFDEIVKYIRLAHELQDDTGQTPLSTRPTSPVDILAAAIAEMDSRYHSGRSQAIEAEVCSSSATICQ